MRHKDHKGTGRFKAKGSVASQEKHKQNSKTVQTFIKSIRETLSPNRSLSPFTALSKPISNDGYLKSPRLVYIYNGMYMFIVTCFSVQITT